jgi:hypothetical protein
VRIFRGITTTSVAIFLALMFGSVALLALGFQLAGYQNPILAGICYVLAFFLFAGSFVALFWNRLRPHEQEAQDAGLDAYFAQMEQWLHGPDAPLNQSSPDERIRVSAQERTIGILPGLSPHGKRRVVRFLHRHNLIKVGTATISLAHADLSSANLSGLALQDSLLNGANLRDANLSDAGLCHFGPTGADWQRAFERDILGSLSQPIQVSHLIGCDLSGAVLGGAHMAGCILRLADFADADLDRADLRAADLRRAENLIQKQIESAYGSHDQQDGMQDTMLPPNLEAPKLWERPLSQQKG